MTSGSQPRPADGPSRWMDAEVHLLHPENRRPGWRPPDSEERMLRAIFDHPDGRLALERAGAEALLQEMARAGVEQACLMGMPWSDPGRCALDNEYVAGLAAARPETFVGFGVLADPRRADPEAQVRRMAEQGLRGVKAIPSWQGWRLSDPLLDPALRLMAGLGLVLVPHTDHLVLDPASADTAHALLEVARRHPDLKILAPHLGGLLCLYALAPDIDRHLGNMLFVTSVSRTMEMTAFALRAAGPGRVAFGTDYPFNSSHDQAGVRAALEGLGLEPEVLRAVSGDTLRGFLGLPAARP